MAAKLVLALAALTIVLSVVVVAAFLYFRRTAELHHEKDLKQMEHTEAILETEETDSSIDRELEREERR